jgi:bacteriocin biosynthesis cyclodehydratase domain-containing protein
MILRIDENRSVVWRTPTTLQFGLDHDALVLDDLTTLDERLISALMVGTTPAALAVLAKLAGGTAADAERLTSRVAPALASDDLRPPRVRLAIDGRGLTAARIAQLAAADERVDVVDDADRADVAIVVARYSIAPARYARWLNRDVDHLAVVHGDRSTVVGPFVRPGSGPCLYCLDRSRADSDAAWPAMASQLEGRSSPREVEPMVSEIAALALRVVVSRDLGGVESLVDRSLEVSDSPIPAVHRHRVHPECGCQSPRGNETVRAASSTALRIPPTTPAVVDVPA